LKLRITVVATALALALASCVTTNEGGDGVAAGEEATGERICQTYKVTGSRLPKTVCRPKKN
jgi:hypothetical protein